MFKDGSLGLTLKGRFWRSGFVVVNGKSDLQDICLYLVSVIFLQVFKNYNLWSCQKVSEAPTFLLDNIYIRFGSKLYRQIVDISVDTNCALL